MSEKIVLRVKLRYTGKQALGIPVSAPRIRAQAPSHFLFLIFFSSLSEFAKGNRKSGLSDLHGEVRAVGLYMGLSTRVQLVQDTRSSLSVCTWVFTILRNEQVLSSSSGRR